MIALLAEVGVFLRPVLAAAWLLGSALLAALMIFAWPAIGDLYGRRTIRYVVALVFLWPVIFAVIAIQKSFRRPLP